MPEYFVLQEFDRDFPSAKEIAVRIAKDYGIVNLHGLPHVDFVRAYLDEDMRLKKMKHLLRKSSPKVFVYPNGEALLDMVEKILPELEEKKFISVPIYDANGTRGLKHWNLYWAESLRIHKKAPRDRQYIPVYKRSRLPKSA